MKKRFAKTEQRKIIIAAAVAAAMVFLILWFLQRDLVEYTRADSTIEIMDTEQLPGTDSVILQQGNNSESIIVNWLTKEKGKYKVQYVKQGEDSRAEDYTDVMMESEAGEAEDVYCYKAVLKELDTDAKYIYRITSLDNSAVGKEYSFQTRQDSQDFSFLLMGDIQIGAGNKRNDAQGWENTLNMSKAAVADASFILSAGDQTDSSKYEEALSQYFMFRSPQILKEIPIAAVRGNHEEGSDLYDLQFRMTEQSENRDYYFQYENTLFICIDSNDKNYEAHRRFIREAVESTQHHWVIVMMHHPLFGGAEPGRRIKALRKEYIQFFSDMDIDLVVSGHEHLYARSYIMEGNESTGKDGGVKTKGQTMYLAAGSSSGSKYDDEGGTIPSYIAFALPKTEAYFTGVKIGEKSMEITTYSSVDKRKIDSCTLKK